MNNENERDFATERDSLEGQYTQHGDTRRRTVHGQYTETEADAPDPRVEGEYTGASHHGERPEVTSTEKRHGNYPKAEH
ncbi:hypothetical protein [Leifsonia poae]|uniref:hypothetical protein n=1 Tax=Leifsonia poae TaxID=110933 RepID=UPI001CBF0AD6|nr:hypothetical protein [Leifsonia poae]